MNKFINILICLFFVALAASVTAKLPSDAVSASRDDSSTQLDMTIRDPNDPRFVWGNPIAIDLSGVNPIIFENAAFLMDPGGMSSGFLYTPSINSFRNSDQQSSASNITRKAAKIGLVHWQK